MAKVVMYSTGACPYCIMAKRLLQNKGVEFEDIRIDHQPERRSEMEQRSRRTSVPQIFINQHHVGGFDDLQIAQMDGELDRLLEEPNE